MVEDSGRIPLGDADDQVLAGRAAGGDIRAFEVLIRRYGSLMQAYARRILHSPDEIDDAVQETFIAAWRQLPDLDDGTAFRSWLITIVSRKSIDQLRRRRPHDELDEEAHPEKDSDSPHRVAEAKSRTEALSTALSRLPENQRRCWVLREASHYSYEDIAEQLDLPVSTVRGILARARKNLMTEMEDWR